LLLRIKQSLTKKIQMNDYNKHKARLTNVVDVIWFGHPGDTPGDIWARQFVVNWRNDSLLSARARAAAVEAQSVVLRWEYKCSGTCSVVPQTELSSASEQGENPQARSDAESEIPERIGRWHRCAGRVKLVVCA
jgi:hypothetical protein